MPSSSTGMRSVRQLLPDFPLSRSRHDKDTFWLQPAANQYIDTTASYWDEYNYWVRPAPPADAASSASCPPVGAVSPVLDFYDGFETGDTSRWTSVCQPTFIQACRDGALQGKSGLCLNAGSTTGGPLGLNLTNGVRRFTIDFKFDPNSFYPGTDGNPFTILKLIDQPYRQLWFFNSVSRNLKMHTTSPPSALIIPEPTTGPILGADLTSPPIISPSPGHLPASMPERPGLERPVSR